MQYFLIYSKISELLFFSHVLPGSSPCREKSAVSAEVLCAMCKYDGYCSSRLNMNMHLLLSFAQKQI